MQEYEYMSYEICVPRAEQEKEVEKMAKQGWRLVSVVGYVFWFERHLTPLAPDAHGLAAENDEEPPEFGTGGWISAR